MSQHMVFHNCSSWQKDAIHAHWLQKVSRIDRLLGRFPEDQRELRLTIKRNSDRFDVRAVLVLPTGTLAAEVSAQEDYDAIDAVADKLVAELRRHKRLIRHDDLYRRKRRRREAFRRAAVSLESDVAKPDEETFFEMLHPLMARLRGHAHHELIVAQLQGRITPGQLTIEDVLDEAILRAWTQFEAKDPNEPLEVWLVRFLHEVLDEQTSGVPTAISIDDEIDAGDPRYGADLSPTAEDDEPYWEEPYTATFDDVLPDRHPSEPWQELEAVEQVQWVLAQLSRLPHRRRRAFTLYVLDGWDPDEIAMIQGRSVEEVRADIEAVQRWLRHRSDRESERLERTSVRRTDRGPTR